MNYRWKLAKHVTLFEKYFRLDEYHLSHELFAGGNSPVFTREIFERGNVVAVLPFDVERRRVVLIEQFRAGALGDTETPWLIECVAGVVEPGETEAQVARRECREESGCEIIELEPISRYYVSPGCSSEDCHLFCGLVDSEGVAGIHGLADENEDIKAMLVEPDEAFAWVRSGKIRSATAIIALQWLELNIERL